MDIERTRARLENVKTVEPMLGALRTISLGTWQSAAKLLEGLRGTINEYETLFQSIKFGLDGIKKGDIPLKSLEEKTERGVVSVLVGAERGLCGRLDQDLLDFYRERKGQQAQELVVFGGRLSKAVEKQFSKPKQTISILSTSMPSFPDAFLLTREWIRKIGRGDLNRVLVYFTAFRSAVSREPQVMQLLPFEIKTDHAGMDEQLWPPPILETDPVQLAIRVYEQLAAVRLFDTLLQTKAAIHSTRFQLMEDSTKNAERLIEELTVVLQMERRQSITNEMQELAVGAGLLKN